MVRRAEAWAAIPSPRPVNPRCSVVVALTLTQLSGIWRSAAMFERMAGMCGAILGACAMIVTSMLAIWNPFWVSRLRTLRRRIRESIPRNSLALSGKWYPMSRRAAAPRRASERAWSATSASLWPSRPCGWFISTPQMMSLRLGANLWTSNPFPILNIFLGGCELFLLNGVLLVHSNNTFSL